MNDNSNKKNAIQAFNMFTSTDGINFLNIYNTLHSVYFYTNHLVFHEYIDK